MMTSILVGLAFLMVSGGNSAGQKGGQFPSITQKEVYLNRGNDGQKVSAKVGQPIVVTLQTIGGGHYGTPHLSSRAVRFESAMDAPPQQQNPGGPKQVYRFTAVAEGETQIRIPHTDSNPAVTFTIQVNKTVTHWRVLVSDYGVAQKPLGKLLNPTGPRVYKD